MYKERNVLVATAISAKKSFGEEVQDNQKKDSVEKRSGDHGNGTKRDRERHVAGCQKKNRTGYVAMHAATSSGVHEAGQSHYQECGDP